MRVLFILLFINFSTINAQNWHSLNDGIEKSCRTLYADSIDSYLYVSGRFGEIDGKKIKGIARWNGLRWDSLGAGLDGLDTVNQFPIGFASGITRFNNELYVCGGFNSLGNVNAKSIGKWNGSYWDSLLIQPNFHINSSPATMTVHNGELYVVGSFDSIGGIVANSIAKWDGQHWDNLDFPNLFPTLQYVYSEIQAICWYYNKLYVGGVIYSTPFDSINNIMSYNGTAWESVGSGVQGSISGISSMVVYHNELYVAGIFTKANGNIGNNIQKWNGSIWEDVGGGTIGPGGSNGQIFSLTVFHDKLYAVGVFSTAGGVPADRIAAWDGVKWCSFESSFDNTIGDIVVFNDSLIVGGGFRTIDGDTVNYIAKLIDENNIDSCSSSLAVEDIDDPNQINIFPNPSTNHITVHSKRTNLNKIKIINLFGIEIYYNELSGTSCQLDISLFSSGLYFLIIETKEGRVVKKFIKE